jgi:hypothetical protein
MMRSRVVGSASIGATYSSIVRNCSQGLRVRGVLSLRWDHRVQFSVPSLRRKSPRVEPFLTTDREYTSASEFK